MRNIKRFAEFVFEGLSGLTKSALDAVTLENPPGSNKGDKVEVMQRSVGISPGDPWCAAFVYSISIPESNNRGDLENPKISGHIGSICIKLRK